MLLLMSHCGGACEYSLLFTLFICAVGLHAQSFLHFAVIYAHWDSSVNLHREVEKLCNYLQITVIMKRENITCILFSIKYIYIYI